MNDKVRIGIVGTSGYADYMYYPRFKNHSGANVVAVCGRNRGRAEELAQKYAIPQVFTDYHEMIQTAELDAVVAAVPDYLHYPVTMAALDAGLHLICEKPMATNLAQAREMLAKAEAAQVRHMLMFTNRWAPAFRTIERLLSQGYIGRCYDAHFTFMGGYARKGFYQWKWDRQYGLGALGDLGAHVIDRARLMVGEIASVQASLATCVPKPHPDSTDYSPANDSASLLVQFANGANSAPPCTAKTAHWK
jgi:predicted dehydrogenase